MGCNPFKTDAEREAYLERARRGWRDNSAESSGGTPCAGPPALPKAKMNKWESAYSFNLDLQRIAGLIRDWKFEPWKFILADGVTYKPDFLVISGEGEFQIHEVKGFMREDARVKLLTCARIFPMFRFFIVQKDGDGWDIKEVG